MGFMVEVLISLDKLECSSVRTFHESASASRRLLLQTQDHVIVCHKGIVLLVEN